MGGAAEVMSGVPLDTPGVAYPVLVPNLKGFEAACASGATRVAVMAAASETFSRNNVNSSIAQATERALEVAAEAAPRGVAVRGYLSCALGCPFEGAVPPELVASLALELYNGGCYEVAISDTIGTGTPGSMARVLQLTLAAGVPVERLAVHCTPPGTHPSAPLRDSQRSPCSPGPHLHATPTPRHRPRHIRPGARQHPHSASARGGHHRLVRCRARWLPVCRPWGRWECGHRGCDLHARWARHRHRGRL